MKAVLGGILGYLLAIHACAQVAQPASSQENSRKINPSIEAAMVGLASDDFAVRERAQQDLGKLDYHSIKALSGAADSTTDPEVKARLLQRLAELREQCATDPPPISLSLKEANWDEMEAKLSEALGVPISGNIATRKRFTIEADDQPFWEVFRALSLQEMMALDVGPDYKLDAADFTLGAEKERGIHDLTYSGPMMVAPLEAIAGIFAHGRPGRITLNCVVALDPRMLVVAYDPPMLKSVVDDAGRELLVPYDNKKQPSTIDGLTHVWNVSSPLLAPPVAGHVIASAKGQLRVEVAVASEHLTVDKPGERLNREFTMNDLGITITRWEPIKGDAGYIDFKYTIAGEEALLLDSPRKNRLIFEQIDASGRAIGNFLHNNHSGSSIQTAGKAPVHLRVTVPTKTKWLEIPFEFKGLKLP